ncbi:acyl-CoA-binding domain-containing protein 3 [Trifolium pratense]|uniref:acyl-CoA-binding domain-containing protein 3 n=1 Tax=Trifolium pratense TaxID=57577 RepID=UPI001E693A98|nr:acyl-CoA-binding domain-containing protein 3 [Trifolium pratense]
MELVTASDLLVTASVALLISFIVAKLVSFATTDTHVHVHHQPVGPVHRVENRLTVHSPQRKSRTGFITPVHVTAIAKNLETEHDNTRDATVVSDSNVAGELPPTKSDVRDATVDSGSNVTGELPLTSSDVTEAKVDSGSNVAFELPATNSDETETKVDDSGSKVGVELTPISSNEVDTKVEFHSNVVGDFSKEETVVKSGDSVERRNDEVVEEMIEEKSTEKVDDEDEDEDEDEDDWEWEGIERSEVEKMFMEATEFVGEKGYIGNCDDDLEMELYGLHKVAMEGPCRESQPMPLKLSARAKWNAWQKLGNMSPEVAMERYISLLSDKFPEWMKNTSAGITEEKPTGSEVSESGATNSSSALSHQQIILTERELVQEFGAPKLIPDTESDSENNVKK